MTSAADVNPTSVAEPSSPPDTGVEQRTIVTIALVTVAVTTFINVAPTGTRWWDVLLTAGLGVLVVVGSVHARWPAVAFAAGVAAMFVGVTPWLVVAVLALAAALLAGLVDRRVVELRALAGALTYLALLNLSSFGVFGGSAVIAGIAIIAILVSSFAGIGTSQQERIRRWCVAIAVATGLFLAAAVLLVLSVRSAANEGVEAARRGLDQARAGATDQIAPELEIAAERFTAANDRMNTPLLKPLALIPIAAQHHRSLTTATAQGALVARTAAEAVGEVELEQLQLRQGEFDLGLLADLAPQLERTASSLQNTVVEVQRVRTGWLLPVVDDQLQELVDEVADVLPEAELAADAARVMPGMLGADGERRYLLLFGAPAESREFGGFAGGYALLAVADGSLDLIEAGSINDVVDRAREGELDDPDSYPTEYLAMEPAFWPQNLTATPNIDLMARAARDVFPSLAGAPIDGVVYADPYALAAMTDLTGPLFIEDIDEPLDRDGLVRFMFEEQYRIFDDREDRFSAIGALAKAMANSFENADLPGPERLGEVLGPAARAGRLQIRTYDEAENEFLASVRLQRTFGTPSGIDSFAVIQTNATRSKLDIYLHRDVHYDVAVDEDGGLRAVVDVELRSIIPDDAPELTYGFTDGTNEVLLSLYSEHDLKSLTVNGVDHRFAVRREFGFNRYALFRIPIAPNSDADVRFELEGVAPAQDYAVAVWSQPLVNLDMVQIQYSGPEGERDSGPHTLTENWLFAPVRNEFSE